MNTVYKSSLVLAFLSSSLLLSGCDQQQLLERLSGLFAAKNPQQGAAAQQAAPAVSFVTIQPQQVVLTDELPGRTSAFRIAEIRPQVSGIIQKRLFTEGKDVKAGDVLYQIDPAPFQAALDNAQATLLAAQKAVDRSRSALKVSLANIGQIKANLTVAVMSSLLRKKLFLRPSAIKQQPEL